MVKTPLTKKYFTPQELADMLGVCRHTIWRYIKAGKLKVVKLSKRNFRIAKKDLEKFLKERR